MDELYQKLNLNFRKELLFFVFGVFMVIYGTLSDDRENLIIGGFSIFLSIISSIVMLRKISKFRFIRDNYRKHPEKCLNLITKEIESLENGIRNLDKTMNYGGYEQKRDERRKSARERKLEILMDMEYEIMKQP